MSSPPSFRKRTSASPTAATENLPPPRKSKRMVPVSAPLSSTRLHRLIYLLAIITTLLGAYYSYRVVQWKSEVGGWWNLAIGRQPPQLKSQDRPTRRNSREDSLEDKINALAQALGMPSRELASAIAVAVREYVPPASLSSVAAKETGQVIEAMIKGAEGGEWKSERVQTGDAGNSGVVGGVVSGMESSVGMDEP